MVQAKRKLEKIKTRFYSYRQIINNIFQRYKKHDEEERLGTQKLYLTKKEIVSKSKRKQRDNQSSDS